MDASLGTDGAAVPIPTPPPLPPSSAGPSPAAAMTSASASAPAIAASTDHPRPFRPRKNTASIDSAITHPGSVRINVQEAYIVESDEPAASSAASSKAPSPSLGATGATGPSGNGGGSHDTKDIRLPNHTAVVSHVAVDVRRSSPGPSRRMR